MNRYKPGHKALRQGRISIPNQIYLITATTHERKSHFSHWQCAHTASGCFDNKLLLGNSQMLACVLMPDHAHWLIQLGDAESLSTFVNRIKSASARHVNRVRQTNSPLWDKGFHDRAIRQDENLQDAARYLIANPLRAGLVKNIGDYPYWNAIWLD